MDANMSEQSDAITIRKKAMDLLARREHSEQELRNKLKLREYDVDTIEDSLSVLKQEGLQSDRRFCESYVNHRVNAGIGPVKIRFELRQKGIAELLADEFLEPLSGEWDRLFAAFTIANGINVGFPYAPNLTFRPEKTFS